MRVIVTGGAGFIGSAVWRHFISELEHDVLVVDKLTYAGNLDSLAAPVESSGLFSFEKRDICDAPAMQRIFAGYRPDAVVHLAAESHVDRSISGPQTFVQTNVVGTFTLLETARQYLDQNRNLSDRFRFIHVSTDEICGSLGENGLFSETTPMIQAPPIRPPKQPPTISQRPGTGHTDCPSSSRIARTTMVPISFPKSSSC
jgi:dTDP-glucose 4,6-dehydratase